MVSGVEIEEVLQDDACGVGRRRAALAWGVRGGEQRGDGFGLGGEEVVAVWVAAMKATPGVWVRRAMR